MSSAAMPFATKVAPVGGSEAVLSHRLAGPTTGTHVLTIALEDYFHVTPLEAVVTQERWYRFEMRLEASTRRTLDLLEECGARATFFVLGWVADAAPELVREVVDRGHEVASKGYYHRDIRGLGREAFRDDVLQAREAIERASGRRVLGYRLPQQWMRPADLWMLEVLAETGHSYDSSIRLVFRTYAAEPWRQFPHRPEVAGRPFLEVPLSSMRVLGLHLPIAGGNYFRQFPDGLMRRAVAYWDRHYSSPYVMYFHTWELDPDQPRIKGVSLRQQIRQYRNLAKMPAMLRHYLESYRFTSVEQFFGLDDSTSPNGGSSTLPAPAAAPPAGVLRSEAPPRADPVTAVSIVVPCYNEEQSLRYLANTLRSVRRRLEGKYQTTFIFVDDGSTDGTWQALHTVFGREPNCEFVRHQTNSGVAKAILTGIERAQSEVVCSIDCDCTYDPHELEHMIPLLRPGIDVVTASPYHPVGRVKNVPQWRLFLSKSLSRLYRMVLRQRIHTYTSCFRVYRRSAALHLPLHRGGFLGIAELLGRLDLRGSNIAEHPTTLESRLLGRSKMKVVRTIVGHLGLLLELGAVRVLGQRKAQTSDDASVSDAPAGAGP
jgi:polysaccharide deacetylase family protein (PEP-CTERM system associated)